MSILGMLLAAAGADPSKGIVGINSLKNGSAAPSLSLTCPSGTVVGDLMVMIVSCAGSSSSIGLATGWTSSYNRSREIRISYRYATSGDIAGSTTYSTSLSSAEPASGIILSIRGAAYGGPLIGTNTGGNSGINTITALAINLTSAGMVLSVFTLNSGNTCTFSTPTGTTPACDLSGSAVSLEVFQKEQNAGAGEAQTSTTSDTSMKRTAIQIGINFA